MAFDGVTVAALVKEFNTTLKDGRIYKIAQTESDELMLTFKADKSQYRMLLSANASLPLIYFTNNNKPSPMTAPNFCMLLRKHINNGRIVSITQPGLERIVDFETGIAFEKTVSIKDSLVASIGLCLSMVSGIK